MSWKSVSFSEIGRSWPSQNIQPAGAKVPANMRISPTYGCAMLRLSAVRGKDALERDAEVERQEWLHVGMRLATADGRDRCRQQWSLARGGGVDGPALRGRKHVRVRHRRRRLRTDGPGGVGVARQLGERQRVRLLAGALS